MISKTGAISGKKNGEDEIGLLGFTMMLKFSESVVVLIFGDMPIYILVIAAIIIFAIVLIIRNYIKKELFNKTM